MSKKQDKMSLTAKQLSTQLAGLSQMFTTGNPGQAHYGATLLDQGQAATAAQEQYIAEKKAKEAAKKKGLGSILGAGVGLAAAPFTGGASLALMPGLSQAGGGIASGDYMGAAGGLASAGAAGMEPGGLFNPTKAVAPTELSDTAKQSFGVLTPANQAMADVSSGYAPYNAAQTAFRGGLSAIPSGMEIDQITGKLVPKKQTNMYDPAAGLF